MVSVIMDVVGDGRKQDGEFVKDLARAVLVRMEQVGFLHYDKASNTWVDNREDSDKWRHTGERENPL